MDNEKLKVGDYVKITGNSLFETSSPYDYEHKYGQVLALPDISNAQYTIQVFGIKYEHYRYRHDLVKITEEEVALWIMKN